MATPRKRKKSIAAIEYPVSRVVGIYMKLKQAIRLFDRRERLREQLRAKDAYPFGSLRRVRKHRQIGAVEAELRRQFDVCSL